MNSTLRAATVLCGVLVAVLTACTPPTGPEGDPTDSNTNTNPTGDTSGDTTGGNPDATTTNAGGATPNVTLKLRADFSASVLEETGREDPLSGAPMRLFECPEAAPENDFPGLPPGSDCDGDGAGVQYVTPSVFLVAVKRLAVVDEAGNAVELVADTGRLRDAQIIDMTSPVTLDAATLPPAHYVRLDVEFYYYEIVMPMNVPSVTQRLRMYLSDDDFATEEFGGHHQGDITLLSETGAELGFVLEGQPWTLETISPEHVDMVYAGSNDPETGHRRGPFGDVMLWNEPRFMQGAEQDVFVTALPLNLNLVSTDVELTVVFNVADTWYYEDYDNDGAFFPCGHGQGNPGDACFEGGGWAALFPMPVVQIVTAPPGTGTTTDGAEGEGGGTEGQTGE